MDDLEFRRRVMSEPKQKSNELAESLASNDANKKFLDEILSLDAKISDAMNVDVPDGLADRILFNQSSDADNVTDISFARKAMAMAASVAFVIGLIVGQLNWGNLLVPPAQASLADIAVTHVINEKAFVDNLDEQVSSRQINAKMAPFSYKLTKNFPYHVYYLNHCGFGNSDAVHMVFQGDTGKVTLFLTSMTAEASANFSKDGMSGKIETIGNKTLILVGDDNEDINKFASNLVNILSPAK